MNIFSLALGMIYLVGAIFCVVSLVASLFTRRWKSTSILWGLYLGSIGLIAFLTWLNDPYARSPVGPAEVVGTYKLSSKGAERLSATGYDVLTGTFTLNQDGTCSANQLPACCIHGNDESVYRFSGGYYSFSGSWTIERSSDVYVVKIEWKKLEASGGGGRSDLPSDVSIHIFNDKPRSLAFSTFTGDFDDIVFERVSNL